MRCRNRNKIDHFLRPDRSLQREHPSCPTIGHYRNAGRIGRGSRGSVARRGGCSIFIAQVPRARRSRRPALRRRDRRRCGSEWMCELTRIRMGAELNVLIVFRTFSCSSSSWESTIRMPSGPKRHGDSAAGRIKGGSCQDRANPVVCKGSAPAWPSPNLDLVPLCNERPCPGLCACAAGTKAVVTKMATANLLRFAHISILPVKQSAKT